MKIQRAVTALRKVVKAIVFLISDARNRSPSTKHKYANPAYACKIKMIPESELLRATVNKNIAVITTIAGASRVNTDVQ